MLITDNLNHSLKENLDLFLKQSDEALKKPAEMCHRSFIEKDGILRTTCIKEVETCETLKNIVRVWLEKAVDKGETIQTEIERAEGIVDAESSIESEESIEEAESLIKDLKNKEIIITDLAIVLDIVKESLDKVEKDKNIYVAYDTQYKVHGIAIATLSAETNSWISSIVTNPDNLVVFEGEPAVRGAGTALIKHVAYDIKEQKFQGDLEADIFLSAEVFYQKVGFVKKQGSVEEGSQTQAMILTQPQMSKLLQEQAHKSSIQPESHLIVDPEI